MSTTSKKWLEGLHRIIFPRALVFFPVPYHMVLSDGDRVKSHAVRYLTLSEQFWIELLVLPRPHVSVIFPFLIFPFFCPPKAGRRGEPRQPTPTSPIRKAILLGSRPCTPARLSLSVCLLLFSFLSRVVWSHTFFFLPPPPHPPCTDPFFRVSWSHSSEVLG